MIDDGAAEHCLIHERSVGLLEDNAAGRIDDEKYVEEILHLLHEQKDSLRLNSLENIGAFGQIRLTRRRSVD